MGGLSVLKEVRKLLPSAHYIYYADNANCPYGEKPDEFIRERCLAIVEELTRKGAEIVVIACNTATAAAVKVLREHFSIPIIGIEPAVKPAALSSRSAVVGVLATASTLQAAKYQRNRDAYADKVRFVEMVGHGFVELVESGKMEGSEAEEVIQKSLCPLLAAGADTVVLGCTHYPFLLDTMRKIAGPSVSFINPAPAVAKHVLEVLQESELKEVYQEGSATLELLASGDNERLREFCNKYI